MTRYRKLFGVALLTAVGLGGPVAAANAAVPTAYPDAAPVCTRHVTQPAELDTAQPGDRVCVDITSSAPITLRKGGLPDRPITYVETSGKVGGVVVSASHLNVKRFTLTEPSAPAIDVHGSDVTVEQNTISSPRGGDGSAIRFTGNDLLVSRNTVDNTTAGQANCMQGTDSSNVTISGNRCAPVDGACLTGTGSGNNSQNWTIDNNYCQTRRARETVLLDDVQRTTISGNTWAAGPSRAVTLRNNSNHATVGGDRTDPSISCEVAVDASSSDGYTGPDSHCAA